MKLEGVEDIVKGDKGGEVLGSEGRYTGKWKQIWPMKFTKTGVARGE